jgi:hypothetical protein
VENNKHWGSISERLKHRYNNEAVIEPNLRLFQSSQTQLSWHCFHVQEVTFQNSAHISHIPHLIHIFLHMHQTFLDLNALTVFGDLHKAKSWYSPQAQKFSMQVSSLSHKEAHITHNRVRVLKDVHLHIQAQ